MRPCYVCHHKFFKLETVGDYQVCKDCKPLFIDTHALAAALRASGWPLYHANNRGNPAAA